MHTGSLPQASNAATWRLRIEAFDDVDNSPINVAALVEDMAFIVRDPDTQSELLIGSISSGELVVVDLGVVHLTVDAGRMTSLCAAKTYEFVVRTTMIADGSIDSTVIGTLPVLNG